MNEEIVRKDNENDELICPITLQLFVDPVKAGDGHVYEREAIQRWILLHGTSPFTRQTLQINDLTPQDYLRKLANQRRRLFVSYDPLNEQVTLPPLQHISTINRQHSLQMTNPIQPNIEPRNHLNRIYSILTCISIVIPIVFILGIVLGLQNSYSTGY